MTVQQPYVVNQAVRVRVAAVELEGTLSIPADARGVVVFAHGSGSSRHSPRNQFVARTLQAGELATLLFDLLTPQEEQSERLTRHLRFDIDLLAARVVSVTDWLRKEPLTRALPIGYFGASTGVAAALVAAVARPEVVRAVVSRGGRPDLALASLPKVQAPTLLVVGGDDIAVIELNQAAFAQLQTEKELMVIPGASHLFEEPGALEEVARLASAWFRDHF